ncbi:hypothetical protein NSA19_02955 [Actinomyces bowdenii]|uniref:hypothetical protein n=1 Tax=Actinomyces bowdenii TaxID=131109 RepID=UPI00214BC4EF|nr:hypothetical protein [Actinomyces bowdenii]MCR2051828.1 hypothetical protein [Actinomyces bowdenii]
MPESHWNGAVLPTVGDDLLGAWAAFANSLGVITPVENVAAAQAILAKAVDNGTPATPAHPAYFNVHGIVYMSDGRPGNRGGYNMKPVNENQIFLQTPPAAIAGKWQLARGAYKSLISMNIPTEPYDRGYMAFGTAWCRIEAGSLDLEIYTKYTAKDTTFKSHVNGQDDDNTDCIAHGIIRAGETPDITMWFKGVKDRSHANSAIAKFELTSDQWTRLMVYTFPISMG